jgi:hypothetical protein
MVLKKPIFVDIISSLLIALFVYAAVSKLLDQEKFRIELGKSPLLTSFAGWVAVMLPILEIGISIMLSFKRTRLLALYASFSLLTLFTAYLIAILQFSFYIPCTCGGVLQSMNWDTHIKFNVAFIVLAVIGILLSPSKVDKTFLLQ